MTEDFFKLEKLTITPGGVHIYIPPIIWKGDSIGHIGKFDVFFFVLEGECFLNVDSHSYIVRKGQLAYLPQGKMRTYTQVSDKFSMYEIRFLAEANNSHLMSVLGLTEQNLVVDIENQDEIREYFEKNSRNEMYKNPLYDVVWTANLINIIRIYAESRHKQDGKDSLFFKPVLEYMNKNIDKQISLSELAKLVYMHPTYFVKRFHKNFGMPPLAYLNKTRIYIAMGMLSGTKKSIDEISKQVGIPDASYFSRIFKKRTGISPTEYRNAFISASSHSIHPETKPFQQ